MWDVKYCQNVSKIRTYRHSLLYYMISSIPTSCIEVKCHELKKEMITSRYTSVINTSWHEDIPQRRSRKISSRRVAFHFAGRWKVKLEETATSQPYISVRRNISNNTNILLKEAEPRTRSKKIESYRERSRRCFAPEFNLRAGVRPYVEFRGTPRTPERTSRKNVFCWRRQVRAHHAMPRQCLFLSNEMLIVPSRASRAMYNRLLAYIKSNEERLARSLSPRRSPSRASRLFTVYRLSRWEKVPFRRPHARQIALLDFINLTRLS